MASLPANNGRRPRNRLKSGELLLKKGASGKCANHNKLHGTAGQITPEECCPEQKLPATVYVK